MNAQDLEDVYTKLCHRLTELGEAKTPAALARLVLLLMKQVDDAAAIDRAIDAALESM